MDSGIGYKDNNIMHDKAASPPGSSRSGNHFVGTGIIDFAARDENLNRMDYKDINQIIEV